MAQEAECSGNRSTISVMPDFEAIFQIAPAAQLLVRAVDPVFTIVAANDAFLRLAGVTREEIIGRSAFTVFPERADHSTPLGGPEVRLSWQRAIADRGPLTMPAYRFGVEHGQPNGEERYWRALITPIEGADRIEFLLHSLEEKLGKGTDPRQMRVALELQDNERRLRLAQRIARIGTFEWLVKEDRIVWTPELEALYGLAEGSFEGNLEGWTKRVIAEDAERVLAGIQDCIARQIEECTYEFRAVLPDGSLRWLRGYSQILFDEAKEAVRLIGVNIDADAQKQAEAHLQQQWRTFDIALSHTPDFNYIFDLQGRFTYANRALLSLLQRSLDQVLGKGFQDLDYPPELANRLNCQIRQVVETKEVIKDQTPFTSPTGQAGYYEYIFVPILSENGQVEAIAGSTRDVTERNRAEELVADDRRRWRELLLQAPAAIAVLRGPEHCYEWVNPDYVRLVGRSSPEKLIGKAVNDALPELASQGYVEMFDRVYRTGEPHSAHEAFVRLGEGEGLLNERYVNFACLATRNSCGEIDGTFVHVTDVTSLVKARKHIEENERQFRTLAETIPNLAWKADADGNLFWYNRRWYDYTGTTFAEMEGWGWQKVHDPQVLPAVLAQWTSAIATGNPFEMVFPLKGADGSFRSFLTRVEPLKDRSGKVLRWFGTNTDIHEQTMIEEELRRVNRELEEFAYVASHDLQEPLRMVSIYSHQILKRLDGSDPKLNQYGAFVREGAARMQALIEGLLTFSRASQRSASEVGTADLAASLSEALSVLNSRIEESGAIITVELPSESTVQGNTNHLSHVFQNLISNALKYRKPGVASEVTINATHEGRNWIVAVRDNGIGFEQRYSEQIFGLFKRLHKDEYAGTGLGLAICRRIIERYGGHIWAESKPGEGSVFSFSLPEGESR